MRNKETNNEELLERIDNIEKRQELIKTVLTACLPEDAKWGNSALFFLLAGFATEELDVLDSIVMKTIRKQCDNEYVNPKELIEELQQALPIRDIKQIFKEYRRDGLFEPICELVLSEDEQI